ncbi:MAG: hypothetical protein EXQ52_11695 [Bryobacterales bacterium]|nr:hypothetical protein [Bryobacterales bacterium]
MSAFEEIRRKLVRAAELAADPAAGAKECSFVLEEAVFQAETLRVGSWNRDELGETLKQAKRAHAIIEQALGFYRNRVGRIYTRDGEMEMMQAAVSSGRLAVEG